MADLDYSGDLASTGSFIDYSPELTVDIPADTTKVSFTVTVSGDSWVEDTETTDISLSSLMFPTGYSRTDGTGFMTPSTFSLTVTDDDSGNFNTYYSFFPFTNLSPCKNNIIFSKLSIENCEHVILGLTRGNDCYQIPVFVLVLSDLCFCL